MNILVFFFFFLNQKKSDDRNLCKQSGYPFNLDNVGRGGWLRKNCAAGNSVCPSLIYLWWFFTAWRSQPHTGLLKRDLTAYELTGWIHELHRGEYTWTKSRLNVTCSPPAKTGESPPPTPTSVGSLEPTQDWSLLGGGGENKQVREIVL